MSTTQTQQRSPIKELTIRGIIIGGLITLVFTAANIYLGLKVGLTFATSIPAAVISMAILRWFKNHSVVENNIVQTIASAAGTLSAIIFVMPGLVMIGHWTGFPYWTTALVCALGGVLGVMYSIPLRRALVTNSDLPYPEGVAAAEVLKLGDSKEGAQENKSGLKLITGAGIASAAFAMLANTKTLASEVVMTLKIGKGGTIFGAGLMMSLLGVGHLVGMTVAIAMVVGVVISFGILLPTITNQVMPLAEPATFEKQVSFLFKNDVRLIGAGAIAIAAVWTFVKIIGPIIKGIAEAMKSAKLRHDGVAVDRVEQDIPFPTVVGVTLASMIPIGALLYLFVQGTPLMDNAWGLVAVAVIYILLIGLAVASVCGYMAGLIGASNSPISGVGIIIVLCAAGLLKVMFGANPSQTNSLIAFTLFTAAVVFGVATISNDNLQDLKTGQLVDATPWKQQVALIIGVLFGSAIIPFVLQLMLTSFGFDGMPGAGKDALSAPQASLLSSLAKGVLGGEIKWNLLGLGVLIGIGVIIIDEVMGRLSKNKFHLPPLAVGMGMYLPMVVTLMIPVGALLGMFYNKWSDTTRDPERSRRLGVLMATGLIVGESLWGVVYAGIVAASPGNPEPLVPPFIGEGWESPSQILGVVIFAAAAFALYSWTKKLAKQSEVTAVSDRAAHR